MAQIIKGKITVKSWKPKPKVLAEYLARDKSAMTLVRSVGEEIAEVAKLSIGSSHHWPAGVKIVKIHGVTWQPTPNAVQKEIKFKDIRPYTNSRGNALEVGLVVSDHPYSQAYQRGALGIRATRFMTKAALTVVGRHTFVKRRNKLR